jgi:ATP-dependent DNA helicase RecG
MTIQALITNGESETVEFKESFGKEALVAIGAFANTKGGTILVGLTDAGKAVGATLGKETLKTWANEVSLVTEPRMVPDFEETEVGGKRVVIVSVISHPIKPVSVKGKYYRRVGKSNRQMNAREVADMHYQSVDMSWDMTPARDYTVKDLDMEKARWYMKEANETGRRPTGPKEKPIDVLEKANLVKDGKPTWAAVLLFGKKKGRYHWPSEIHCGRFKGETEVIDDRMALGPLFDQVDDAMEFVQKNINVRFVMTGRPAREQVWDYPLKAVREAIINAVCHRDYTISSDVEVRIYDDELMVWSPGGLPLGITFEELFRKHPSILRNKGIGKTLFEVGWIEQWGTGIGKIRDLCMAAGLPEPAFEERQGFRVTFRKDIYNEEHLKKLGLNERQVKAMFYLKARGKISNREYRQIANISDEWARVDLADLISKGLVRVVGKGRSSHYVPAQVGD